VATLPPRRRAAAAAAAAPAAAAASATAATRAMAPDASTQWLEQTLHEITATRVAPPMTPRRNVNPPARRRRWLALAFVGTILLGLIGGAILVGSHSRVPVPNLRGLSKAGVSAKARLAKVHPAFSTRHSSARKGIAIAQSPRAGTTVTDGGTVHVVLSGGPPPISVPQFVGGSASAATAALQKLGLRAQLVQVPAPGVTPGLVTHQSPATGSDLSRNGTVALSVAETPRWRALTSFAGDSSGSSVPFRIRGTQWRVVYGMNYHGMCTFIFFCSGPSANVVNLKTNSTLSHFGLHGGTGKTKVFTTGPGLFQMSISHGGDTARWTVEVQDYY
jgi:hypothetical protein